MLRYFGFTESPKQRKARLVHEKAEAQRRMKQAVPWDPKMKFVPEINITAETYKLMPPLWDLEPVAPEPPSATIQNREEGKHYILSKNGRWMYRHMILPKGEKLTCCQGRQRGSVLFDGRTATPMLNKMIPDTDRWERHPWMSLTPMEHFTLRGGTRLAKGKVIIGGLGMGYQLWCIAQRKQVTEIIIIEQSADLLAWIRPQIKTLLPKNAPPIKFKIGDARSLIPKMEADRALIDIWPSYGGNTFPHCPNIGKVWCWGSQYTNGSSSLWG